YKVMVTANDGHDGTAHTDFKWFVNGAPVAQGGCIGDQNGNQSDSVDLATAHGFSDPDDDPLSYTATGLPTGLKINPATGQISGTLSTSGTYSVNITANDGHGGTAHTGFNWFVNGVPVAQRGCIGDQDDKPGDFVDLRT